jgi:hypothetical protein
LVFIFIGELLLDILAAFERRSADEASWSFEGAWLYALLEPVYVDPASKPLGCERSDTASWN